MTHPLLHPEIVMMFAITIVDGEYRRIVSPVETDPVNLNELIAKVEASYENLRSKQSLSSVESYMLQKINYYIQGS